MNLTQRIEAEKLRVSSQLEQLKAQNETDIETLEELKINYHAAALGNSEEEMDNARMKMDQLNGRIQKRQDIISAMQHENNPIIQNMIVEEMEKWFGKLESVEGQAKKKLGELESAYTTLLKGLQEVNELYRQSCGIRQNINNFNKSLKDSSRRRFGDQLPPFGVDVTGPLPNEMRSLLIEEREIFKR